MAGKDRKHFTRPSRSPARCGELVGHVGKGGINSFELKAFPVAGGFEMELPGGMLIVRWCLLLCPQPA